MAAVVLAVALSGPAAAPAWGEDATAPGADPKLILTRFTEFIAGLERFRMRAETGFDVVQEWGQKIEFGGTRTAVIRRPDRLRLDFQRRDGQPGRFVFDGRSVSIYSPSEKVYASAEVPTPGDLDAALDYLIQELNTPIPLADLLDSQLPQVVEREDREVRYVGVTQIDGVRCHHLAILGTEVDHQVWIPTEGDPLPRRLVISYRTAEGHPQFWARFLEWDLSPEVPDSLFELAVPEGTERIPFASRIPGKTEETPSR
jgi:hypothetical protein